MGDVPRGTTPTSGGSGATWNGQPAVIARAPILGTLRLEGYAIEVRANAAGAAQYVTVGTLHHFECYECATPNYVVLLMLEVQRAPKKRRLPVGCKKIGEG